MIDEATQLPDKPFPQKRFEITWIRREPECSEGDRSLHEHLEKVKSHGIALPPAKQILNARADPRLHGSLNSFLNAIALQYKFWEMGLDTECLLLLQALEERKGWISPQTHNITRPRKWEEIRAICNGEQLWDLSFVMQLWIPKHHYWKPVDHAHLVGDTSVRSLLMSLLSRSTGARLDRTQLVPTRYPKKIIHGKVWCEMDLSRGVCYENIGL